MFWRMPRMLLFLLALTCPIFGHARVFNYQEAWLAVYMRGTSGLSAISQEAFANSSGTDTGLDGKSKYTYSGELGLSLSLSRSANLRLSASR